MAARTYIREGFPLDFIVCTRCCFVGPMNSIMLPSGSRTNSWRRPLVELVLAGNQRVLVDDKARPAVLYAVKPKLGAVLGFVAAVPGKTPADHACVILAQDVPAFVRCDGPLFLNGPIWRIELTTAH
jgi:hypothetical protein